jgi:hypothetical protein
MSGRRDGGLVSFGVCNSDVALDDDTVVRCAQIATFVAAHNHAAGGGMTLTMRLALGDDEVRRGA